MKTIEEKARAYDNAMNIAKKIINDLRKGEDILAVSNLEIMFPELKVIEDEKMIRRIIETLQRYMPTDELVEEQEMVAWLEKKGEKTQIDDFDTELNALLKKYDHLPKKELQEPLEFYLGVVKDDLDVVRENPNHHEGWVNIYKHDYCYTLSREMCNTCDEAKKYSNKNTVATIKIYWEE